MPAATPAEAHPSGVARATSPDSAMLQVMPVAGTLGASGARFKQAPAPQGESREPAAASATPPGAAHDSGARIVDAGSLHDIWAAATEELAQGAEGGSRLARIMPCLRPARLEGKTLILEKPRDAPKLVDWLMDDPLRGIVEAELSRRLGTPVRLMLLEVAATLPLEGTLLATRLGPTAAPARTSDSGGATTTSSSNSAPRGVPARTSDEEDDLPPILSDDDLHAEMERHAPPREKLRRVLEQSEELRRGVALLQELLDGDVVRIDGEDL